MRGAVDDEQAEQLRRLGESPTGRGGSHARRIPREYGDDDFPEETVLVFRRLGHETRSAVKVDDTLWRVTGRRRLRPWEGLIRVIGRGYEISFIE